MATLNIELSRNGVDKVRAGASTISDSIKLAQLIEASAVGIRLLDQSIVEHFEGKVAADAETAVVDEPSVLVKTDVDGLLDVPRRIKVQVGTLPRDPYDAPPAWFVEGCKKLFPKEDWANSAEETAVSLFYSECSVSSLLDHWGWVGAGDGNDVLISEPYGIDSDDLKKLEALCDKIGWTFSIQGVSGHYPSATIRIVINPREKGFCHVR
jgi:hypothetical protein